MYYSQKSESKWHYKNTESIQKKGPQDRQDEYKANKMSIRQTRWQIKSQYDSTPFKMCNCQSKQQNKAQLYPAYKVKFSNISIQKDRKKMIKYTKKVGVLLFPRQEYWSGLPFPSPGDLPDPGIEPTSPALAGRFFTIEPPGMPHQMKQILREKKNCQSQ